MHYACPVLFRLYRTLASPILAPDYAIYCRRKNDALFFPKIKYLFPPIHSDAAAHTLVVVHYRVIGLWGVNRKSLPLFGRFRPSSRSRAGGGCKVEGNERRKRWPIFQPSSSSSIIIAYSLAPLQWCNTAETAHASVVSPVDVLARESVCVCTTSLHYNNPRRRRRDRPAAAAVTRRRNALSGHHSSRPSERHAPRVKTFFFLRSISASAQSLFPTSSSQAKGPYRRPRATWTNQSTVYIYTLLYLIQSEYLAICLMAVVKTLGRLFVTTGGPTGYTVIYKRPSLSPALLLSTRISIGT